MPDRGPSATRRIDRRPDRPLVSNLVPQIGHGGQGRLVSAWTTCRRAVTSSSSTSTRILPLTASASRTSRSARAPSPRSRSRRSDSRPSPAGSSTPTTGKGLAGVPIHCLPARGTWYSKDSREAKTDADGRYSIAASPGVVKILPAGLPQAGPRCAMQRIPPTLELTTDQAWPDLKLVKAVEVDGIVVDETGQPVVGAEVYMLDGGPLQAGRSDSHRPGGTFHLDQLDPDAPLSLWARTMIATTDGRVTVRPRNSPGKLTLTIDPKFACQIRGMAADANGKRIAGANVKLWWGRPYVEPGRARPRSRSVDHLELIRDQRERLVRVPRPLAGVRVRDRGRGRGHTAWQAVSIIGKSGETHDVGKIVLFNTSGTSRRPGRRLRRPAGERCGRLQPRRRPARPWRPQPILEGQFQLESLAPGTKYVFVRKDGYRFTGVKVADDADDLPITMQKTNEPPPAWKPAQDASFDQERAFAKRILIRLWEKYGAECRTRMMRFECILAMAPIDLPLALKWSAERGHQYDSRVRQTAAEDNGRDRRCRTRWRSWRTTATVVPSRSSQKLAERFAARDPAKALQFADEAVARARRARARTSGRRTGGDRRVLVRAGRADAGRKLIDEAAGPPRNSAPRTATAQARAIVAAAIAPGRLKKALALVEPITAEDKDRYLAFIARAIAKTDTARAVALADEMNGPVPVHERVKTAIAYKIGADRPDEAIKIIEGIKRDDAGRWQAEAFGWLAVALAPRDRARAFATDRPCPGHDDRRFHYGRRRRLGRRDAGGRARRRPRKPDRLPRHGERRHAGDGRPARQLEQRSRSRNSDTCRWPRLGSRSSTPAWPAPRLNRPK